jgi:hypothetical protein
MLVGFGLWFYAGYNRGKSKVRIKERKYEGRQAPPPRTFTKNKIMKTKVYSAFPGVGKTTYFNTTDRNVLDSDSSKFDKKHFPDNYIEHIERNIQDPKVDKILVSSHKDVRDALLKKGIPFVLVYPNRDIKDEYIQRYKDRGNNDAFVDLLEKNWDNWMDEMDQMEAPQGQTLYKVKLGPGQYLADVID